MPSEISQEKVFCLKSPGQVFILIALAIIKSTLFLRHSHVLKYTHSFQISEILAVAIRN